MPERAKDGTSPSQTEAPRRPLAADYAAIEDALAATPRGRWFLAEYARRNRTAETELLLEAIAKLETAVLKPQRQTAMAPGHVFAELVEMSEAIARTRREIAQIKPPMQFDQQLVSATEELDHIVEATEKATSDILAGAEEIQEVAWTLRERGTDIELCDKIDQRATDIYTACSFQDITGQRTGKVVRALRFIEQRINAMIEIWGVDDIAHRVDDIASRMQTYAETALREGVQSVEWTAGQRQRPQAGRCRPHADFARAAAGERGGARSAAEEARRSRTFRGQGSLRTEAVSSGPIR